MTRLALEAAGEGAGIRTLSDVIVAVGSDGAN
jgi:hypothetical protein